MTSDRPAKADQPGDAPAQPTDWQPAADVYRMPDGWLLKVELAGVCRDEFQLLIEGQDLILSGQRRDWVIEQGRQSHSMEITYASFERHFSLPLPIEDCRVSTEYRDGMLMIRVIEE